MGDLSLRPHLLLSMMMILGGSEEKDAWSRRAKGINQPSTMWTEV